LFLKCVICFKTVFDTGNLVTKVAKFAKYGNPMITINSLKFNKTVYRSWKADLIEEKNSLLTFIGEFEDEIKHPILGVIRRGTISYEYYWLDRWYNVFRFHEPDGELRNFYCNINMPPKFENGILDYIDLDIDLFVLKDFSYQILDLEEFEENARKYSYSDELRKKVRESLSEVISLINKREFPFDYKF